MRFLIWTLFIFLLAGTTQAANVVVNSTCVLIDVVIKTEEGNTSNTELECPESDPSKTFRIKYFWLDATQASILFSGYSGGYFEDFFGKNRSILRNEIFADFSKLIADFGTSPEFDSTTDAEEGIPIPNVENRIATKSSGPLLGGLKFRPAELAKLRIFEGDRAFAWPDVRSTIQFMDTVSWPSSLSRTYYSDDNVNGLGTTELNAQLARGELSPLECVLMYKPVSVEEFGRYDDELAAGRAEIKRRRGKTLGFNPELIVDGAMKTLSVTSFDSGIPYGFLSIFAASGNWPDDFLFRFGHYSTNDCGGTSSMGFWIQPRRPFLLVAVVQSKQSSFDLNGLVFGLDESGILRSNLDYKKETVFDLGEMSFKKSEALIIPLRMELRYNKEAFPISALGENQKARTLFEFVNQIPEEIFSGKLSDQSEDGKEIIQQFEKQKSELASPKFQNVEPIYYWKNAYELRGVRIQNQVYSVRKAQRTALFSNGYFEEGSCPFFRWKLSSDQVGHEARILVAASSEKQSTIERKLINSNYIGFDIIERELETTYLDRVTLRGPNSVDEKLLFKNVVLAPGEKISYVGPLPKGWTLVIQGHYEAMTRTSER
jgi:hypothetical protein